MEFSLPVAQRLSYGRSFLRSFVKGMGGPEELGGEFGLADNWCLHLIELIEKTPHIAHQPFHCLPVQVSEQSGADFVGPLSRPWLLPGRYRAGQGVTRLPRAQPCGPPLRRGLRWWVTETG